MTAFTTSLLPTSINTVEELAVWALSVLSELNPTLTIVESAGRSVRQAEIAPFWLESASTPTWAWIGRVVITMPTTWRQGTARPWDGVQELTATAIPTGYRT
jgi:hypothetical protein